MFNNLFSKHFLFYFYYEKRIITYLKEISKNDYDSYLLKKLLTLAK